MKLNKKNIYITLFGILYGGVALVSLIHAVSFFALANLLWLAILLAVIFEIGQSAVLFSILTSSTGKSKVMPWTLMCILTIVQILGNVFSSYKYIISNSPENLRFFKEPVFIWTDIPDAQATVIITYIVGGILPLVALAMSAMVTNYLEEENENKKLPLISEENKEKSENISLSKDVPETPTFIKDENPLINQNSILQMENQSLQEQINKLKENLNKKENIEENKIEEQNIEKEIKNEQEEKPNNDNEQQQLGRTEDQGDSENELSKGTTEANEPKSDGEHILERPIESIKEENIDKNIQIADVLMGGNILKEKPKKPSHFIN